MSDLNSKSIVTDLLSAGYNLADPKKIAGTEALLIPPGASVKTFEDLEEKLRAIPSKLVTSVTVEDADSFIAYYNRFADEHSTVFLDTDQNAFVGVLDYHNAANDPRRGNHRLQYTCPKNREWNDWIANSGKKMEQVDLALFIEQHIEDIREPSGAQMLEIATSLKAGRQLNFERSTRLDNGQTQFLYNEVINGTAGPKGELIIPDEFKLGLQPMKGSDHYEVRCKFRWRINNERQLIMWYDVIRPDKVRETAINDVREKIQKKMIAGMILNGKVAM